MQDPPRGEILPKKRGSGADAPLPLEFRTEENEFMFYLEFSGNIEQPVVLRLLNNFQTEYNYFRFHGNFLAVN